MEDINVTSVLASVRRPCFYFDFCEVFMPVAYLTGANYRYLKCFQKQRCERQENQKRSFSYGDFSNKKYYSYACWTCSELCEAFTFLMENIYLQFDGMVYQQIMGIPMGTNCAPTYFYFVMRGILCQTSRNPNGFTS